MHDAVKNCDVSRRANQVLFRSVYLVRTEDLEDDYFERKIGIKPHLRPLDLKGELISIDFYFMECEELRFAFNLGFDSRNSN